MFPTAEYEERRRARIDAGATAPYMTDQFAEEARHIAQRVGCEFLGIVGVDFEAIGGVDRTEDLVIDAVRDHGYTKVYVASPRRTLWQRLFGTSDLATRIAHAGPPGMTVVAVGPDAEPPIRPATDNIDPVKAVEDSATPATKK